VLKLSWSWKPEQRSGTSRQVEGGAPRLLPFRLRFSNQLMLSLCDIFAGYIVLHLRFQLHSQLTVQWSHVEAESTAINSLHNS